MARTAASCQHAPRWRSFPHASPERWVLRDPSSDCRATPSPTERIRWRKQWPVRASAPVSGGRGYGRAKARAKRSKESVVLRPYSGHAGGQVVFKPLGTSGSDRRRTPHALKIAFAIAGASPTMGHSPAPAEGRSLRSSRTVSTAGRSLNRGTR